MVETMGEYWQFVIVLSDQLLIRITNVRSFSKILSLDVAYAIIFDIPSL